MIRCAVRPAAPRWLALFLGALVVLQTSPAAAQAAPSTPAPRQVPQLLGLKDAIAIALEGSNQLGMQQAQLEALRKQRLNSWFNLGPDLAVGGSTSRSYLTQYDVPQAGQDTTLESRSRGVDVSTSVRLFDGLANYMRISASNHDVTSQEHSLEYARQSVQELVIQTYFNLLRYKLLAVVAKEAEQVAKEQLDRTRALYELGSAARSDVLKSQVQHDLTRLDLVKAQQAERQAHVDLEWAMNLENPTAFDIDTTVSRLQFKTTSYEIERDYALRHRENLLSFRAGELAADRRVWAARGTLLPTIDFRAAYGRSWDTSPFKFTSDKTGRRYWEFAANWNLWDRYLNYAQIGQARANHRISTYQRRQAELDAIREVRRLVNTMDEARERLEVSRQTVASAQEDLRLAQERFRVGSGTILDTVVAESDLTRAKANVVQAIVDYLIARAQLARATGRPLSEV